MPVQTADMELISRGDRQAFERLFREHFKSLCLFTAYRTKDTEAAREIVQELFCSLWEKRCELQVHTSLKAYLYRAAHNSSLNYLKHRKVQIKTQDYIIAHSQSESYEVEEEAIANELGSALETALSTLPEKTREIFELIRFKDMKYKEVAEKMGVSQKTVEAHMTSALKLLRTALQQYLPGLLIILSLLDRVFPFLIVK